MLRAPRRCAVRDVPEGWPEGVRASGDNVSKYLETVGESSRQSEANEESREALSDAERSVLRVLFNGHEKGMKTTELITETQLGSRELIRALERLEDRGLIQVSGVGTDEEVRVT
jgi:DNA-binding MarR family transcriptional regulator